MSPDDGHPPAPPRRCRARQTASGSNRGLAPCIPSLALYCPDARVTLVALANLQDPASDPAFDLWRAVAGAAGYGAAVPTPGTRWLLLIGALAGMGVAARRLLRPGADPVRRGWRNQRAVPSAGRACALPATFAPQAKPDSRVEYPPRDSAPEIVQIFVFPSDFRDSAPLSAVENPLNQESVLLWKWIGAL